MRARRSRPAEEARTHPAPEPVRVLHQFFERTTARHPDRVAVEVPPGVDRHERRTTTYRELAVDVERLIAHLSPLVSGECVLGILLPRDSHLLYAAQIAALSTGAAYVCLEPSFPDAHLRFVLEDAGAIAVLTDAAGLASLGNDVPTLDVRAALDAPITADPRPRPIEPSNLAYLIYTSGTTGHPKGVAIEHRGIVNLIASDLDELDLRIDDRAAQGSSAAYDSAVEETWLAFATGATLVVMDDEATRLGPDLADWLRRERITILCPTPTLLRTMACADPQRELPDLRFVYVGGEALPQDLADRWSAGRTFVNGYGPTECSVTVCRAPVHPRESVTIGEPVRGNTAHLLDEHLNEVPEGDVGELCIGGVALARGYLDRPELTAERFPTHPELGRIYRTGDLARRDDDGALVYLGRIDAQVKLHGHRIELQEIEAQLADCNGVREAACRLQGEPGCETLVALVVPTDAAHPPDPAFLRTELETILPTHMVPSRYAAMAELPTTIGGKLDRRALPEVEPERRTTDSSEVRIAGDRSRGEAPDGGHAASSPRPDRDALSDTPSDPITAHIAREFARCLDLADRAAPPDADFFDLGGDSVRVAVLVSHLREHGTTAGLTVRDVYEARTVTALAERARATTDHAPETPADDARPAWLGATVVQTAWLVLGLIAGSALLYALAVFALPFVVERLGTSATLLTLPAIAFLAALGWTPVALAIAASVKRLLIGRYTPRRTAVWSDLFVRNWFVQRAVGAVPWGLIQGTELQSAALRALGARIGRRVHIHRGVDLLTGGWDLLDLGDDVTVSRDASLGLAELDDGHLVLAPVRIGHGVTLEVRSGVAGDTELGDGAYLTALSALPRGARVPPHQMWDGVPARPIGRSPTPPAVTSTERTFAPATHAVLTLLARLLLAWLSALPFPLLAIGTLAAFGIDTDAALAWLAAPSITPAALAIAGLVAALALPCRLLAQALTLRLTPGVAAGTYPRFGLTCLRVSLRTRILENAGVWLSGALLWPMWLRLAGMRVGRDVEISTVVDVLPEQVTIRPSSFLADGIYLGGARLCRGTVTVAPVALGRNTFLGNHVVVPAGTTLPDDVLLGVCTVADPTHVTPDSAWFGHPPFRLPRREVVTVDRRLTHEPSAIRYLNRLVWEIGRFGLPAAPIALAAAWYLALVRTTASLGGSTTAWLLAAPAVTLATALAAILSIVVAKWLLLGRVGPGQHPLWSCWCSRWDFLYVAWGYLARVPLTRLGGTLWLGWCLRAFGTRIGRRVVLGPGFAQVVDPDMLTLEDGATVDTMFQAHSFEDRVLKIDHVRIGRRATIRRASVLLYGADIGEHTHVAPHSVVMKRELLLPHRHYEGVPTRPAPRSAIPSDTA